MTVQKQEEFTKLKNKLELLLAELTFIPGFVTTDVDELATDLGYDEQLEAMKSFETMYEGTKTTLNQLLCVRLALLYKADKERNNRSEKAFMDQLNKERKGENKALVNNSQMCSGNMILELNKWIDSGDVVTGMLKNFIQRSTTEVWRLYKALTQTEKQDMFTSLEKEIEAARKRVQREQAVLSKAEEAYLEEPHSLIVSSNLIERSQFVVHYHL